ncbi:MAG: prepilin-type N-terminal cleavage/methylation domain-containing protein [Phycisphaerae bacterium]|nr:prepilin-type N-terminal cleavage/methylation domain-containing protein [Phycisphaerae bacterium]
MTRRAFTLLELLTALAVSGVVLAGIGSALLAAARALPPKSDPVAASLSAAEAVATLTDDLRFATTVTTATATAVQFTVPDRTGDGTPETIRYEWPAPGGPLLRTFNGAQATLIDSVAAFELRYTVATATESRTTTTTSAETLFASFDGWSGVTPTTGTTTINATSWGAEYFSINQPGIPRAATNFRFTRVRAVLHRTRPSGDISVAIHRAIGGGSQEPPTDPMSQPAVENIASYPIAPAWIDIPLPSGTPVTDAQNEFVLVIKGANGGGVLWSHYTSLSAPKDAAPTAIWSVDSGASWNPSASDRYRTDHRFQVYGTYDLSATANASIKRIQRVELSLRSASAAPDLASGVRLHNEPEAP